MCHPHPVENPPFKSLPLRERQPRLIGVRAGNHEIKHGTLGNRFGIGCNKRADGISLLHFLITQHIIIICCRIRLQVLSLQPVSEFEYRHAEAARHVGATGVFSPPRGIFKHIAVASLGRSSLTPQCRNRNAWNASCGTHTLGKRPCQPESIAQPVFIHISCYFSLSLGKYLLIHTTPDSFPPQHHNNHHCKNLANPQA